MKVANIAIALAHTTLMKDARWIHQELERDDGLFALFHVVNSVLSPRAMVPNSPLASQVSQAPTPSGIPFHMAIQHYVAGEVGLWFYAGWHDQASLEVFDVKKGDVRVAMHMLARLDEQQPAEIGDTIWGYASIADDWVLLLKISRERRSFHATLRATTVAVSDLIRHRI